MPIDDMVWKNCRKCGHRYADHIRQCPRCGYKRSSAGVYGAVGGGIAAAIIAGIFLMNSNILVLPQIPEQEQNAIIDTVTDTITPQEASQDDSEPVDEATQIEYVLETKTEVLLDAGSFLSPNDVRTFNLQIPNEDVERLEGTIVVDGDQYLHVEITDNFGANYCMQESLCSFDVYGEYSGKSTADRNNKVSIPIDSGDALKLIVTNPTSAELQTVSIDLSVSYQILHERVVPVVEEEPEEPIVVPIAESPEQEEPEATEEPTSGGIGRDVNPDKLAMRVHELINEQRMQHSLPVLTWDEELAIIAERHSLDMAARDYFSHDTPEGKDPTARAEEADYHCRKDYGTYYTFGIAENLYQHWTYDSITYINGIPIYHWNSMEKLAQDIVEGWMGSTGHRQNILTEGYDRQGIGVVIATNDKIYITENFC